MLKLKLEQKTVKENYFEIIQSSKPSAQVLKLLDHLIGLIDHLVLAWLDNCHDIDLCSCQPIDSVRHSIIKHSQDSACTIIEPSSWNMKLEKRTIKRNISSYVEWLNGMAHIARQPNCNWYVDSQLLSSCVLFCCEGCNWQWATFALCPNSRTWDINLGRKVRLKSLVKCSLNSLVKRTYLYNQ